MRRNAQIQSQVFVLILAAVVFIMVLAFGYRALRDLNEQRKLVALVDVVEQLKQEVRSISLSFGSTKKLELTGFPSNYKKLCIVTGRTEQELAGLEKESPLIRELYQPDGAENVFLLPERSSIPVKLEAIEASSAPKSRGPKKWFCTIIDSGVAVLYLEGIGNGVLITEWPQA